MNTRAFHRLPRRGGTASAYGLAPLVDVVLLLLIFLLISARFDRSQVVEERHRQRHQGRCQRGAAVGMLAIPVAELRTVLAAAGAEERLLPLVIRGDRAASLGDGLALLEFVRGLGYPHCVFQVEATGDGPPTD